MTTHDYIAGFVSLGIAGLSVFLSILAYGAYKKTRLSRLKFIVIAFSLFVVLLSLEALEEFFLLSDDTFDLLQSTIILFILISFFFGVMKKPANKIT